jgi:hypothetical protein
MAKVILRVHVAYVDNFLSSLEAQAPVRRRRGERACVSGVEEPHRNVVYAILDWESVSAALEFWKSPEAQSHKAEWHSVEQPQVTVLREGPND